LGAIVQKKVNDMHDNEIHKIYAKKVKIRNSLTVFFVLTSIIFVAVICLVAAGYYTLKSITEIYIFAGGYFFIELLIAIISLVNWRCPRCSAFLGRDFFSPNYCKTCGVKLR
jgi:hypothetical protein